MHGHVTVQHCIDARSRDRMMNSRPPTRSSFDNDERHVTAFRPISEAALSWSWDKIRNVARSGCGVSVVCLAFGRRLGGRHHTTDCWWFRKVTVLRKKAITLVFRQRQCKRNCAKRYEGQKRAGWLCIEWSGVTVSMATIRSPFCGYNMAWYAELTGEG